jgi:hypothetical protein
VQSLSAEKAPPPTADQTAIEKPEERSEALLALSIIIGSLLTSYFGTQFQKWFGFSEPLAFALGAFSAWTIAWTIYRPKRIWLGYRWIRITSLSYFLLLVAFALAGYLGLRILHSSVR